MVLPEVFSRVETKNQEQENGSNELDALVLNNNKPENLIGSENAIIITI
jgi:hypothetical protein